MVEGCPYHRLKRHKIIICSAYSLQKIEKYTKHTVIFFHHPTVFLYFSNVCVIGNQGF